MEPPRWETQILPLHFIGRTSPAWLAIPLTGYVSIYTESTDELTAAFSKTHLGPKL